MKKILLFLLASLLLTFSYAQTCTVYGEADWEKVDVRLMTVKEEKVKGYELTGEGIIEVSPQVQNFEDLNEDELKEIKKYAAKLNGCIVFVDIKGFWESTLFPTRAENKVYFYWFTPK